MRNGNKSTFSIQIYIFNTYSTHFNVTIVTDCILHIKEPSGILDFKSFPERKYDTCIAYFPIRETYSAESPGLLIEMQRLNVPCDTGGYIQFSNQSSLCGKLEDLAFNERVYYFPFHQNTSVVLHKNPLFNLKYKLVDYCYNITLTERNSSILLEPKYELECSFKIHLPYGNRIELSLYVNFYTKSEDEDGIKKNANVPTNDEEIDYEYIDLNLPQVTTSNMPCQGVMVQISNDGRIKNWTQCVYGNSLAKKYQFKSNGNTIVIHVSRLEVEDVIANNEDTYFGIPSVYFEYNAIPIPEIVSQCAYGWVAIHQFCITAIEHALPWKQAENECKKIGGHLASIKSEREQNIIDTLLFNR